MFRLAHDDSVLVKNPNTIFNRSQMMAMKFYRSNVEAGLTGEEFKEAIKEQIGATMDALGAL